MRRDAYHYQLSVVAEDRNADGGDVGFEEDAGVEVDVRERRFLFEVYIEDCGALTRF